MKSFALRATLPAAIAILVPWSLAAAEKGTTLASGEVKLQSAGALELGPDGVLFVADSEQATVFAIDTEVGKAIVPGGPIEKIGDLDAKLAAMLGVEPRDVVVKDMAVHQPSGRVFLSIMRGSGDDAEPVIMTVSPAGQLQELPLGDVKHAKLDIGNAPADNAKTYSWESRSLTVTDLEYIDGTLYIAGLSNEEFASTLRRAAYPFDGELETTGLEIFHGAHGEFETFAPIFSFMEYELNGKPHVLASYLCTPLVTFPIDELRAKTKLRGKTIAELGFGNVPFDMIGYEHGGERYVLLANSRRGTMKFKASDIERGQMQDGITSGLPDNEVVMGVPYVGSPLGHVVQIADFDDENVLILWREMDNGSMSLATRAKKWL